MVYVYVKHQCLLKLLHHRRGGALQRVAAAAPANALDHASGQC